MNSDQIHVSQNIRFYSTSYQIVSNINSSCVQTSVAPSIVIFTVILCWKRQVHKYFTLSSVSFLNLNARRHIVFILHHMSDFI